MVDPEAASEASDACAKQAACLECRKSKVKCIRAIDATACRKCLNAEIECVVPEYHVGRYKGVKNKRSGLEKAIYQVEEAVKKARTSGYGLNEKHARALEALAEVSREGLPISDQPSTVPASESTDAIESVPGPHRPVTSSPLEASFDQGNAGDIAVNNASNPLQLLAIASAIPEPQDPSSPPVARTSNGQHSAIPTAFDEDVGTKRFFNPIASKLDLGIDRDPVDLGLVTVEEADQLFARFHAELAHTRWGLDSNVHTAGYVRKRSSYLFTAVLAAAALFVPDAGPLSKRLNNHCRRLFHTLLAEKYRSVEIVIALLICVPWIQPGDNWAMDDESCSYLSIAMSIAIDLSLHKIVIPSSTVRSQGTMERTSPADCIEAQKALNIDGHTDVAPNSIQGRRLLRARERAWLALFALDRGVCLARGRPWTVPLGPLVDTCDAWHVSDIADQHDGGMIATCVLRRDFGHLVSNVRAACDNNTVAVGPSATTVKNMREKVEGFFSRWHSTWLFQLQQADGNIPPYIEILVSHGKLSAYCNVINHPTASAEIKQFFRAAGLTAALDVLRVAVQNETRLKSMPNNSVIMVSFAACFVLALSTMGRGGKVSLPQNAYHSIQQAADVLVRIGTTPSHRNGASVLFGRHIKRIIQQHAINPQVQSVETENKTAGSGLGFTQSNSNLGPRLFTLQPPSNQPEHIFPGFDSMTDDQLLAAIQNSNDDLSGFMTNFPMEDNLFMDWLDWPTIS